MTAFMASVRNVAEARVALAGGADIVDIKEPGCGALGAVAPHEVAAIVAAAGARAPTSATIGDLMLEPTVIAEAVRRTAQTGVSVVKIGLFPGDLAGCLRSFERLLQDVTLAAVLFADALPARPLPALLADLASAGVRGVVFDTAGKTQGGLPDLMETGRLARVVSEARALGLFVGLAGSLKPRDIPALCAFEPDILGFRGALCDDGRAGMLSPERIRDVRQRIPRNGTTQTRVHDMLAVVKRCHSGEDA